MRKFSTFYYNNNDKDCLTCVNAKSLNVMTSLFRIKSHEKKNKVLSEFTLNKIGISCFTEKAGHFSQQLL